MRLRAGAVVLVAATGCAQLAGIDETTGLVPPERVSLRLTRRSIGATIVDAPLDVSNLSATFLVANADAPEGFDRVPAEAFPDAFTWSAEIPEGTPSILFNAPDYPVPIQRVWNLANRNLEGLYGVMEHPSPTPAPANAMLTVQAALLTPYDATESFSLLSIGTWNTRPFTDVTEVPAVGATQFGPVTFPFTSTSKLTNRPHEKITTADAVLLLRYVGTRLTGVMEAPPFDQTGDDMLIGSMIDVGTGQTLTAQLDNTTVSPRYAPLRPAMGNIQMGWLVVAAPGFETANMSGPALLSGVVTAMDPATLSVSFDNPFVAKGWPTTMQWGTSASRTFTPAGAPGPATLSAGLYQIVAPTPMMTLDLPAGLPELISLDSQTLSSDGVMIPRPTKALTASFLTGPATITLYQMQLYELVPNMAGTALDYKVVFAVTATTNQFIFPPEAFEPGKSYTLRAIAVNGGYPSVADGDLTVRTLPLAVGYMDSGVFTVMP